MEMTVEELDVTANPVVELSVSSANETTEGKSSEDSAVEDHVENREGDKGCCGCCGVEKGADSGEHLVEDSAYTFCVIFNYPLEDDPDCDEKRRLLAKTVRRLMNTLTPDRPGDWDDKTKGRVVVMESVDPRGVQDVLEGSCPCCPTKLIHHNKVVPDESTRSGRVCMLVRASQVALHRIDVRKKSTMSISKGQRSHVRGQEGHYTVAEVHPSHAGIEQGLVQTPLCQLP